MDALFVFIAASLLLALTPGPDNLFVLAQSALYGKKAGLIITLGLCTGLIFHTTLVALGVAVIFQASWALNALTVFGATYMLYLAFKMLTAPALSSSQPLNLSTSDLYKRGIIMNSTNPKVTLFFLAFLPQFINADSSTYMSQTLMLGSLFAITTLFVFGCISLAGGSLQTCVKRSPTIQLNLNRTAALVMVFLAISLLL